VLEAPLTVLKAIAIVLVLTTAASADGEWWTSKPETRTGKFSMGGHFTIDLPKALEQVSKRASDQFIVHADGTSLAVSTMSAEAQHPYSYEDYKSQFLRDRKILIEEPAKRGFAVLYESRDNVGFVAAVIVTPAGEDQTMCTWVVPASEMQGKSLPAWPAMKKACATLAFAHK